MVDFRSYKEETIESLANEILKIQDWWDKSLNTLTIELKQAGVRANLSAVSIALLYIGENFPEQRKKYEIRCEKFRRGPPPHLKDRQWKNIQKAIYWITKLVPEWREISQQEVYRRLLKRKIHTNESYVSIAIREMLKEEEEDKRAGRKKLTFFEDARQRDSKWGFDLEEKAKTVAENVAEKILTKIPRWWEKSYSEIKTQLGDEEKEFIESQIADALFLICIEHPEHERHYIEWREKMSWRKHVSTKADLHKRMNFLLAIPRWWEKTSTGLRAELSQRGIPEENFNSDVSASRTIPKTLFDGIRWYPEHYNHYRKWLKNESNSEEIEGVEDLKKNPREIVQESLGIPPGILTNSETRALAILLANNGRVEYVSLKDALGLRSNPMVTLFNGMIKKGLLNGEIRERTHSKFVFLKKGPYPFVTARITGEDLSVPKAARLAESIEEREARRALEEEEKKTVLARTKKIEDAFKGCESVSEALKTLRLPAETVIKTLLDCKKVQGDLTHQQKGLLSTLARHTGWHRQKAAKRYKRELEKQKEMLEDGRKRINAVKNKKQPAKSYYFDRLIRHDPLFEKGLDRLEQRLKAAEADKVRGWLLTPPSASARGGVSHQLLYLDPEVRQLALEGKHFGILKSTIGMKKKKKGEQKARFDYTSLMHAEGINQIAKEHAGQKRFEFDGVLYFSIKISHILTAMPVKAIEKVKNAEFESLVNTGETNIETAKEAVKEEAKEEAEQKKEEIKLESAAKAEPPAPEPWHLAPEDLNLGFIRKYNAKQQYFISFFHLMSYCAEKNGSRYNVSPSAVFLSSSRLNKALVYSLEENRGFEEFLHARKKGKMLPGDLYEELQKIANSITNKTVVSALQMRDFTNIIITPIDTGADFSTTKENAIVINFEFLRKGSWERIVRRIVELFPLG